MTPGKTVEKEIFSSNEDVAHSELKITFIHMRVYPFDLSL